MKRLAFVSVVALSALLGSGCQTARAPATSPELKAAQHTAQTRQRALEQRVADHLAAQSAISNQADRLHADLLAAAQDLRSIKEKANQVSVAAQTNRLALESLRGELDQQRAQLEALDKQAQAEAEKIKTLQAALAREEQARVAQAAALKAEADRVAAEERKKADDVKAALAKEQELRQREQAAVAEKEKEIAALRKSLAERDQMLRTQAPAASAAAGAAAATAKPAEASAVKQVAEGNAALRQGKLDEAEKLFKAALVATPGMVGARIGLAACRYERGDLAEADTVVTAVLKEDRRNAQALGLKGLVHWRRGELDDAEDVLEDAIKQDKLDSQLRNYLGIVQYERKKADAAVASLRKAVDLDPANAEARYNLSVVLAMHPQPQLDEARVQYDKAVELGSARDQAMEKLLAPAKAAPAAAPKK